MPEYEVNKIMDTFYSAIKALTGIAVLYFLCDALISSEKFKPYVRLVLGLAVVLTLAKPITALLKTEPDIMFNIDIPSENDSLRDDIENIWRGHSSGSLRTFVGDILYESFPSYKFTVRTYRHESGLYRIYVTVYDNIPQSDIRDVKNLICAKTGISADYVNIYLQNPQTKEDTQ